MTADSRRGAAAGLCGLAVLLGWLPAACRIEGGAPVSETDTIPGLETQVALMLEGSAEAWNRGDLEAFMSGYLRSPTTTYLGTSGLVGGWDAIRARYAPLFQAGSLRDSLRVEQISVRPLGDDYALATARYALFREGRVTSSGPFTLVLWRTAEGWKIVHDQSAPEAGPASGAGSSPDAVADSSAGTGDRTG